MSTRPAVLHITWQAHGGRAEELAAALGGKALHVHPRVPGGRARSALGRYAVSALSTAFALARLRPRAVIVTNPPLVPGLIAAVWSSMSNRPFVLDSHTSSFGVKGNDVARRLLPLHRQLARRAAGVMVTTDAWVRVVDSWGGCGLVVHEAPPLPAPDPPPTTEDRGRPRALFVCVFSDDEPVEAVLEAAARLPDIDVYITGDLARCTADLVSAAPHNVTFTGFVRGAAYAGLLRGSDVVIALTTEPTSVMRAAYEAVYAERSLVTSDWPDLRDLFPTAAFCDNTAGSLAAAVRRALDPAEGTRSAALAGQTSRWEEQLASLRAALGLVVAEDQDATAPRTTT